MILCSITEILGEEVKMKKQTSGKKNMKSKINKTLPLNFLFISVVVLSLVISIIVFNKINELERQIQNLSDNIVAIEEKEEKSTSNFTEEQAKFILEKQKTLERFFDNCIREVDSLGEINNPDPMYNRKYCINHTKTTLAEYNLLLNLYGEEALPELMSRTVRLK